MPIIKSAITCFENIKIYNWFFELENNQVIKLSFEDENFTHLILGTTIIKHLKQYKGLNGYSTISNTSLDTLKNEIKTNSFISKQVQNVTKRIKYFPEVESILKTPTYFYYDPLKVVAKNKNEITADYALRKKSNTNDNRTTLFIREQSDSSSYISVTCLVDNSLYKHTCNQEKVKVINSWKEKKTF